MDAFNGMAERIVGRIIKLFVGSERQGDGRLVLVHEL
jgi:hypothetical protein